MAAPFVDVDVDGYWRPPYPVKSWKVRPESLLVQAGASLESRAQAKLSPEHMLLEVMKAYTTQISHGGLASKLAEELCWQIHDNPVFRFHLVREGLVETLVGAFRDYATLSKILMSISAVLGAVASTPEGKDRAFRAGGINVMYTCIQSHGDHNDVFVSLGGIELLMDIIKFTSVLEESPVIPAAGGDMSNELIATAARALRATITNPLHMDRAIKLGLVDLTLAVLMLRGHQPDVLEWMFALLRDICSFGGYRPLVLASPHDPVYNIIRMTVKHCMKKVRTPPPNRTEGIVLTHDMAVRHTMTTFAYMCLDSTFCEPLIEFGAIQVIVEVVRNIIGKTPVGVCHAATAAILNGSLHQLTRQEFVDCGAVATVCGFADQVLQAGYLPDSDEALVCKVLSTCMGALSALALSPDTVTLPSRSESSLDKLSTAGLSALSRHTSDAAMKGVGLSSMPSEGAPDLPGKRAVTVSSSKTRVSSAGKSRKALRSPAPKPVDGCAMVDLGINVMLRTVEYGIRRAANDVIRAGVQAIANISVLPWVQSAVADAGCLPVICGLLETHWQVPAVVNAVCCVLANFSRTITPSFRPMLYELTDTTKRVIRVMYSNIDKPLVIEHLFAALANLWLTSCADEEAAVMAAMTVASSMQSIHTVLRQQQNHSGVQTSGYKALRNLAAVGDESWAGEVGKVFLGSAVAIMRLKDDENLVQQSIGACLAVMCRSAKNREAAAARDAVETFVAGIHKHLDDVAVTVALTQAVSQMALGLVDHPEQFSRDVIQAVLDARRAHHDDEDQLHWTLALVNNISRSDNDFVVWLTRKEEGMPLLLEARRLRLKNVFSSAGPGPLPWKICMEVAPVKFVK